MFIKWFCFFIFIIIKILILLNYSEIISLIISQTIISFYLFILNKFFLIIFMIRIGIKIYYTIKIFLIFTFKCLTFINSFSWFIICYSYNSFLLSLSININIKIIFLIYGFVFSYSIILLFFIMMSSFSLKFILNFCL